METPKIMITEAESGLIGKRLRLSYSKPEKQSCKPRDHRGPQSTHQHIQVVGPAVDFSAKSTQFAAHIVDVTVDFFDILVVSYTCQAER